MAFSVGNEETNDKMCFCFLTICDLGNKELVDAFDSIYGTELTNKEKYSGVLIAIRNKNIDLLKYLLTQYNLSEWGRKLIHESVLWFSNEETLGTIFDHYYGVLQLDEYSKSKMLIEASHYWPPSKSIDIFELILKTFPNIFDGNIGDILTEACYYNQYSVINYILKKKQVTKEMLSVDNYIKIYTSCKNDTIKFIHAKFKPTFEVISHNNYEFPRCVCETKRMEIIKIILTEYDIPIEATSDNNYNLFLAMCCWNDLESLHFYVNMYGPRDEMLIGESTRMVFCDNRWSENYYKDDKFESICRYCKIDTMAYILDNFTCSKKMVEKELQFEHTRPIYFEREKLLAKKLETFN